MFVREGVPHCNLFPTKCLSVDKNSALNKQSPATSTQVSISNGRTLPTALMNYKECTGYHEQPVYSECDKEAQEQLALVSRCQYTKSNPIDDHCNISSKKLQKQNFKPLDHYTCMQCGTSHLQKVQENILSHIILATYRKFTLRFTQNVTCNIFTHLIYQQVANVTV